MNGVDREMIDAVLANPRVRELIAKLAMLRQPEWVRDTAEAIPTKWVRQLVDDFRVPPTARGRSPIPVTGAPEERRPSGPAFVPFAKDPPGWAIIDQMLNHQDAQDRADRLIEHARRRAALQRSE